MCTEGHVTRLAAMCPKALPAFSGYSSTTANCQADCPPPPAAGLPPCPQPVRVQAAVLAHAPTPAAAPVGAVLYVHCRSQGPVEAAAAEAAPDAEAWRAAYEELSGYVPITAHCISRSGVLCPLARLSGLVAMGYTPFSLPPLGTQVAAVRRQRCRGRQLARRLLAGPAAAAAAHAAGRGPGPRVARPGGSPGGAARPPAAAARSGGGGGGGGGSGGGAVAVRRRCRCRCRLVGPCGSQPGHRLGTCWFGHGCGGGGRRRSGGWAGGSACVPVWGQVGGTAGRAGAAVRRGQRRAFGLRPQRLQQR